MKVQRAIIPNTNINIWIVLDGNYLPVQPIQSFLRYLTNIERSPNTIRTYAYHLKLFWEFVVSRQLQWESMGVIEMADFINWLRDPQPARTIRIYQQTAKRTESSVNAILSSVAMLYDYHSRFGTIQNNPLYKTPSPLYGRYKNFLHGIGKAKPSMVNFLKLKTPKFVPKVITLDQVKQLIDACDHIRDKFLVSLLYETGMRIGQVLGLRHEDIHSIESVIYVVPRNNASGVRAKTRNNYPIDVPKSLMRLYADYLVDEVQDNISDYVFINLWRDPIGKPMTIGGVEDLFRRLSKRTGIQIHPHILRHTHATELIRSGWDSSYVQKRLGHSSIQTTINTYVHLSKDDLKKAYQEYQTKKENKLNCE